MRLIALVLLLASTALAADVPATQPAKDAYIRLRCTDCFASAFVGPDAVVATDVKALNAILELPDAKDWLLRLQQIASPEGQLYAMCGLYIIDRETFNALASQYQDRHGAVQTIEGCIIGDAPIARVFNECVANGSYPELFRKVRGKDRLASGAGR